MKTFVTIFIINSFIPIIEINAICGEFDNSEWKLNGTNCGTFCADLLQPELICDPKLNHLGCFCKEGYYRDKNLQCVLPETCGSELPKLTEPVVPPEFADCPHNEMFDNCSSRCLEFCSNREDPISCPINCDTGCFCRGSRLRNNDGVCVPILECEPLEPDRPNRRICPYGEMYLKCGNRCQELCPTTKKFFGISLNCNKCEAGCFCEPGLFRGNTGSCVKKKRCNRRNLVGNIMSSIFNVMFNSKFAIKANTGFNAGFSFG